MHGPRALTLTIAIYWVTLNLILTLTFQPSLNPWAAKVVGGGPASITYSPYLQTYILHTYRLVVVVANSVADGDGPAGSGTSLISLGRKEPDRRNWILPQKAQRSRVRNVKLRWSTREAQKPGIGLRSRVFVVQSPHGATVGWWYQAGCQDVFRALSPWERSRTPRCSDSARPWAGD